MASRIIDVDYYAGGDRKVVTSVDVYKSIRALQLGGVTNQREASVITPEVMNYRNLENRIDVTIREG